MQAMVDLHSHILPGLDDGAPSLEISVEMARIAVESGVRAMVATPHCDSDRGREVYHAWKLLRAALHELDISLQLGLGMEIYGSRESLKLLRDGRLFTLNQSRYPLVEFDFLSDGYEETRILKELIRCGFRPLVAHPERYRFLQERPELLNEWAGMGCCFQINRGSYFGRFGQGAYSMAMEMTDRGFATVVASDAHSPIARTPWMRDVQELLADMFSEDTAQRLLLENPSLILKNREITFHEPEWF